MRKYQSGLIDPLSLIGLGFLVVTLLVGTVAVNKQNANYDTRSRAKVCADECIDDSDCGEGQQCSRSANGCPVCRARRQSVSAPQPAPVVQPGPVTAPDDSREPEEVEYIYPDSVSVPTSSGGTCCPKSNTAGAVNTCKGLLPNAKCTNQSVCQIESVESWSQCSAFLIVPEVGVCCPKDDSASAKMSCPGASHINCDINQSVCEWRGGQTSCSAQSVSTPTATPSPTPTFTPITLPTSTPTPTPTPISTPTPTPIYKCSTFGSCVPINYVCEKNYGQFDCRDSQKCGVHCSAPVMPSPTSTPQCSNLCKADPCCKCSTCDGNTALECNAVCNILQPSSTPTLTPTSTSTPTPTPTPFSPLGLCEITEQCPGGYTCLNSHCVNNVEIEQCAADATVLANAAVGSNGITLDASYVPPNLVDIRTAVPNAMYANYEILIQQDAVADINCLVDGLVQNGYDPVISYGYRPYELQAQLHETYGDQAATAGNSQHQTGLAFDIHQYATVDENGNTQFFEACTLANTPECEPTRLAISIAAECGIAHPLGWDAPHFFDVTAACPGLDTFVESVQNPTATYYDELNAMIAQIQQRCLQGL